VRTSHAQLSGGPVIRAGVRGVVIGARSLHDRLGSCRRTVIAGVLGLLMAVTFSGAAMADTASPSPSPSASPTDATTTPTPTSSPSPTLTAGTSASTSTPTATATQTATTTAAQATMAGYPRFYRPAIKRGDADGDVYHIKHVRELQYRLRWNGVYTASVTGYFGPITETAVKTFQHKYALTVTGQVNLATWQKLIAVTTRALSRVPAVCKYSGWHSCYDRYTHQLFGYYSGTLWNVWLVRGGSYDAQTDLGTFTVYARYVTKTSSIYGTLMYFFQKYNGGEGLHGSVTMIDPFVGHSHGCVNMYIRDSKVLWDMSYNRRHVVTVYGAWS
jgi:hypothetical protein